MFPSRENRYHPIGYFLINQIFDNIIARVLRIVFKSYYHIVVCNLFIIYFFIQVKDACKMC